MSRSPRENRGGRLPILVAVVAALVVTLMPLPSGAALPPGGTFTDDDGNFHEGAIEAIAAAGITKGCNPPFVDRYCPAGDVDRGAMAAFLRRALDLPDSGTDFFTDDNGSPFEADINAIAEAGITTGCRVDEFCPHRTLRRDEMASFLARAFDLTQMTPPTRPGLGWTLVVGGLDSPIQALAPPGEARLLIAEQGGLIKIFENGSISPTPFLNLQVQVDFGGEKGLLSMAVRMPYPEER